MTDRHISWIVWLLSWIGPIVHAAEPPQPIKVFILAGQSNMEGQAVVDLDGSDYNNGKGTLSALFRDPAKARLVRHLKNDKGDWSIRDDVWVWYQREDQPLLTGPLALGFSVYGDLHHFGPELQFGHVVGNHFSNQVLLIKTAWGGKSLYEDFRPPSSGGKVGPYYTKMLADIRRCLQTSRPTSQVTKARGTSSPAWSGTRAGTMASIRGTPCPITNRTWST